MDNEMIERVAEVLSANSNIKFRIAVLIIPKLIKAMRKPTEKMLALGPEVQCWPEVIDAIVGDE